MYLFTLPVLASGLAMATTPETLPTEGEALVNIPTIPDPFASVATSRPAKVFRNRPRYCPYEPIKCDSTCKDIKTGGYVVPTGQFLLDQGVYPPQLGSRTPSWTQKIAYDGKGNYNLEPEASHNHFGFDQVGSYWVDYYNQCPYHSNSFRIADPLFKFQADVTVCDDSKVRCSDPSYLFGQPDPYGTIPGVSQVSVHTDSALQGSSCVDSTFPLGYCPSCTDDGSGSKAKEGFQYGFEIKISENNYTSQFWQKDSDRPSDLSLPGWHTSDFTYEYECQQGPTTCADGGKYPRDCATGSSAEYEPGCNRVRQVHFFNRRRYVEFRVCKLSEDKHPTTKHYVAGGKYSVTCTFEGETVYSTGDTHLTIGTASQQAQSEDFMTRFTQDGGCTKCLPPIKVGSVCTFKEEEAPLLYCPPAQASQQIDASADKVRENSWTCDENFEPIQEDMCSEPVTVEFHNKPYDVCTKIIKCADIRGCNADNGNGLWCPEYNAEGEPCRIGGVIFQIQCWQPKWTEFKDAYAQLVAHDDSEALDDDADGITKEDEYNVHPTLEFPVLFNSNGTEGSGSPTYNLQATSPQHGMVEFPPLPFGSRCLVEEVQVPDAYKKLQYKFWTQRLGRCDVCEAQECLAGSSIPSEEFNKILRAGQENACQNYGESASFVQVSAFARLGQLMDQVEA